MQQTSKKEQKPPFLPLQHAPITLTGGNLYAVSSVPDCQTDRPITYLHTHDSAEFGICLEGNGVFMIGGRIFPFRGGDCTFIPAWLPHLAQSAAHTVSRWYWLSLDTARLLVWAPELADLDGFTAKGRRVCSRRRRIRRRTGLSPSCSISSVRPTALTSPGGCRRCWRCFRADCIAVSGRR